MKNLQILVRKSILELSREFNKKKINRALALDLLKFFLIHHRKEKNRSTNKKPQSP